MSERERCAVERGAVQRGAVEGGSQTAGGEEAGISPEDALWLVSLAPRERLLSLSFRLGVSRTEELVSAMTLISLGEESEALAKLRALEGEGEGDDGGVARRLAETLESRGRCRSSDAARGGGGRRPEPGGGADAHALVAVELARVFRLLADERLCDGSRRDRAYRAALRACSRRPAADGEDGRARALARLAEEAGEACGRAFASCQDGETLRSGGGAFPRVPLRSTGSGGGTPVVRTPGGVPSRMGRSESTPPSSLRTVPSGWASYPTHLELSASPTALFDTRSANRDAAQDPGTPPPRPSPSEERREPTRGSGGVHSVPADEAPPVRSLDRRPPVEDPSMAHHRPPVETPSMAHRRPPVENPSMAHHRPPVEDPSMAHRRPPVENPSMAHHRPPVEDPSMAHHRPPVETPSESVVRPVASPGYGPQQRPLESRLDPAGAATLRTETLDSRRVDAPGSVDLKAVPMETPPPAFASLGRDSKTETRETRGGWDKGEEEEEEEEEEVFFAFVILHSPADEEVARHLQERLESLGVGPGAIFTEEFAVPGKHRLSCVDDAVNNSAFTILFLSRNFNARMLEFEANVALLSSLESRHKSNSVIPLLPRGENRLPRDRVPTSLRIFVPLDEGARGFERMARKAMAPSAVARQRAAWRERRARERNERSAERLGETRLLQEQLRIGRLLSDQQRALERGYQVPFAEQQGGLGPYWYPTQPSIHIENASYVMIGNDSQMTFGAGGERPPSERGEEGAGGEERE